MQPSDLSPGVCVSRSIATIICLYWYVKTFDKTFKKHFRRVSASVSCRMLLPTQEFPASQASAHIVPMYIKKTEGKKALKRALKCPLLKALKCSVCHLIIHLLPAAACWRACPHHDNETYSAQNDLPWFPACFSARNFLLVGVEVSHPMTPRMG